MKDIKKKIIGKIIREWKDRKNIPFKISRNFKRFLNSFSKNQRPSSYPYVSGDSFRCLAQHILDEESVIDPLKVEKGDIVFVGTHFIEQFFHDIHPHVKNEYKLITHNSDKPVSANLVPYIDDKIIHWYGQNVDVIHPKITPIPIGLENLYFYHNGDLAPIKKEQRKIREKENKILFGFSVSSSPKERQVALDALLRTKSAEKITGWPNTWEYLELLNRYKFIAAPPGNGIDAPREWQAMYLKVVPILKGSIVTRYYAQIGLPVLVIENWEEILDLDEKQLKNIYEENREKFNNSALYFDYWRDMIIGL